MPNTNLYWFRFRDEQNEGFWPSEPQKDTKPPQTCLQMGEWDEAKHGPGWKKNIHFKVGPGIPGKSVLQVAHKIYNISWLLKTCNNN